MQTLDRALRSQLESTIKNARDIAEIAARAALEQICVGSAKPDSAMSGEQVNLRRRLRAHGRQLGDVRDNLSQTQNLYHLVEEVAYQHWHRMLFARFLAENGLLMYFDDDRQDASVSVSLEECNELAEEMGSRNGWELASRFASKMLPQIFRVDSPVFELDLAPEYQKLLEEIIGGIPSDVFHANDSIGWVYQFWQSKKKEHINKSGVKIGADEIPAVTQLFTEPYMVNFIIDNTIGAWWASKLLKNNEKMIFDTDEEIRNHLSTTDIPLNYLRLRKISDTEWIPASQVYEGWPESLGEMKLLDPCCGSGHFLIQALIILTHIRAISEKLTIQQACNLVLSENLYGLEIDNRCVEIAAFGLALCAWKLDENGGYRTLPKINVACVGTDFSQLVDFQKHTSMGSDIQYMMQSIENNFRNSSILGSLINPYKHKTSNAIFNFDWSKVENLLISDKSIDSTEVNEFAVAAQDMHRAIDILSIKYDLILTNVPFLGIKRQNQVLRNYCMDNYPDSQSGLETVFLERIIELLTANGVASIVINQTWLFQPSSKILRRKLLSNNSVDFVVRLGSGAFETISGEVVNVCITTICKTKKSHSTIKYMDLQFHKNITDKIRSMKSSNIDTLVSDNLVNSDDCTITSNSLRKGGHLSEYVECVSGLKTGDKDRFNRYFWEIDLPNCKWEYYQVPFASTRLINGCSEIIFWENDEGQLHALVEEMRGCNHVVQNYKRGQTAWKRIGIAVSATGELKSATYHGDKFDSGLTVIIPKKLDYLKPLWSYFSSAIFSQDVRSIDSKLGVTTSTFLKLRFDYEFWNDQSEHMCYDKYSGLVNDCTQWTFPGSPSIADNALHVAVAKLLGYIWPAENAENIMIESDINNHIERTNSFDKYSDKDGIVCIPAIGREASASDRLINLLAASYGQEWTSNILTDLITSSECFENSLESWLRNGFFIQHCKLFQNRPFIWHIWDGQPDGFSALLNYHKLNQNNLQVLIYSYLDTWIKMQKEQIRQNIDGAEDRLSAAEGLRSRLLLILEGELPYDIFVRWKKLSQQPIGWNPDLDDGVRINIRPWMSVPDIKKRGAGVLRDKPNIKWDKDRGQDVVSAPWYDLFKGDRINDHHLTLKEKRSARADMENGGDRL